MWGVGVREEPGKVAHEFWGQTDLVLKPNFALVAMYPLVP